MKADTVNHSLKAQDLLYKRPLFKYIGSGISTLYLPYVKLTFHFTQKNSLVLHS